jgi:DNA polymerase III gamma/tau subunit
VRAIADRDGTALLDVAATLIGHGHDLRNFCRDLLAVFRDLLVFKLADSRPELFESSTLSHDQLAELSMAFTRSDLLRFFHSFAATETELKTATQPRYALETGLIKLAEMRSVESVETLLARLLELEQAIGSAPTDGRTKAAAATEEKKTLNSAPEPVLPPAEPTATDVPEDIEPEPNVASSASETLVNQLLSRIKFSLPDLDENLREHVDDAWLDARYEADLRLTGDDLSPIRGAAELLGLETEDTADERRPDHGFAVATAGAAAAPAFDRTIEPVEDIAAADYPPPPADATPEELRAYVEGHPAVRSVIRIFRAEITEIRRTGR